MMTRSAARTSASVNVFCAPTDPWVSTLIVWPCASAPCCRLSAAMKVWAIPVGHEVTATIFAILVLPVCQRSGRRHAGPPFLTCYEEFLCTTRNTGRGRDGHLLDVRLQHLRSREVVTGICDRPQRK